MLAGDWVIVTQVFCKIGQAIIHELHAIYIFKLTHLHGFISLKCLGYNFDLMRIN
jgi:hypothetical protein